MEEERKKDKVRKEDLEKTWRNRWEQSMENEENERRSECEKQRIQEDEMRKKMLEENGRREFEQKMENEKRDKLRGKNEGECDEEGTIGRDVEERVGAKHRE